MPDSLPLLLSLLEEEPVGCVDFYVRYHTVQLLRTLLASSTLAIQEVGGLKPPW